MGACSHPASDGIDPVVSGVPPASPPGRPDPLPGAWLAVAADRIAAVVQGEPPPTPGATVIDGTGRYLTPGLIDGHVHLAAIPGLAVLPDEAPPELYPALAAYEEQLPRSYLYHGFTTVIDLNVVDADFLRRFEAAPLRPDLHHCGGALALANGYPMAWMPPEVRFDSYPNFLWDERQSDRIPSRFAPEDHSPPAAVARVAESGGICVKTHWEDGFGPQKIWPTPTPELIAEVITAAHARDLTVTMHANSHEAHRFAVDAGVDVIVHGLWNWDGLTAEEGLPAPIVEVLDDAIERGIGVMPTTRVLGGLRDLFDADFLYDPRLADVVPATLIDWYRTEDGRAFAEEVRRDFDGAEDVVVHRIMGGAIEAANRVVAHLAARDAETIFGSDPPSAPTRANPPGLHGALEMELLAVAGVAPRQILRGATRPNARSFHLEDQVGTIEVGKRAHLLLLRADPLASATAWSEIESVIVGGELVEREALRATR